MDTVLARRAISVVLCFALAATAFALGGPAHADTWRHQDAIRDVRVAGYDQDVQAFVDVGVSPGVKRGDIGRVTVIHSPNNVRVATSLRRLYDEDSWWTLRLVTSRGDVFDVQRRRIPAAWPDDVQLHLRRNGDVLTCDGITVTRTRAGIIADLPRDCLDTPWKVRVGVQMRLVFWGTEAQTERQGLDDGLRDRRVTEGISRLGPWIEAG